jgi:hypothetical protein
VAALVKAPSGRSGRPSKSLTLEQAQDLLRAAEGSRLYAYVVLSVTTGLRTGNGHLAARDHPALAEGIVWIENTPEPQWTPSCRSACGGTSSSSTPTVYRKVIVPELRHDAEVMDRLFI